MLRGYAERVKKKLELQKQASARSTPTQQQTSGRSSDVEPQTTDTGGSEDAAALQAAASSTTAAPAPMLTDHTPMLATQLPAKAHAAAAQAQRPEVQSSTRHESISLRRSTTAAAKSGLVSVSQTMRSSKLQKLAEERAAAKAKASALKQARQQVALSAVLSRAPQLFDRDKISAVEKFVTHVDELPARYQAAQIVFLSKNSLTGTSGIVQFAAVRVLSLADNLLSDVDEALDDLSTLPCLEVLSLDGNPLASFPFYRARVVARLPRVKTLDGKDVRPEERLAATGLVEQEQAYLAVLMRNACLVHKMVRTFQQLQLHRELFASMYGVRLRFVNGIAPTSVPINPQRMMELWDYEGSLSHQERRAIQAALRREVIRRRDQLQVQSTPGGTRMTSWDEAFTQVMLAQQQTITQLLEMIGSARAELAEEVRLRVTARVINEMHAEEDVRRRVLQDDREQLVAGLRTAFQQLSPGSKVLSGGAVQRTPNRASADERSSRALQAQATRVLFKVTAGSPAAKSFSPERKLEVEARARPKSGSSAHVMKGPTVARPSSAQAGAVAPARSAPSSPTAARASSRGTVPVSGLKSSRSTGTLAQPQPGRQAARKQVSASSQKLSLRRRVDAQVRQEMQEHGVLGQAALEQPRWRSPRALSSRQGAHAGPSTKPASSTASSVHRSPDETQDPEPSTLFSQSPPAAHAPQLQQQPSHMEQQSGQFGRERGVLVSSHPADASIETAWGGSAPYGSSMAAQAADVSSEISFGGGPPAAADETAAGAQAGRSPRVNAASSARQAHPTLSSAALQQLRQRTRQLQQALLPLQQMPAGPAAPWAPGATVPLPLPPPPPLPPAPPATYSWGVGSEAAQQPVPAPSPLPVPQAIPPTLLTSSRLSSYAPGGPTGWFPQQQQPSGPGFTALAGDGSAAGARPSPPPPPLPPPPPTFPQFSTGILGSMQPLQQQLLHPTSGTGMPATQLSETPTQDRRPQYLAAPAAQLDQVRADTGAAFHWHLPMGSGAAGSQQGAFPRLSHVQHAGPHQLLISTALPPSFMRMQVQQELTHTWEGPQLGELRTSTGASLGNPQGPGSIGASLGRSQGPGSLNRPLPRPASAGPPFRPGSAGPQVAPGFQRSAISAAGEQEPAPYAAAGGPEMLWSASEAFAPGSGARSQHFTAQRELFPGAMPTPEVRPSIHTQGAAVASSILQQSTAGPSSIHIPGRTPVSVDITPEGGDHQWQEQQQHTQDQDQHIHLHLYPTEHQQATQQQPAEQHFLSSVIPSPVAALPEPLSTVMAMGVAYERIERYTPVEHYAAQGLRPAAASPKPAQQMDLDQQQMYSGERSRSRAQSLRAQLDDLQAQLPQEQVQERDDEAQADYRAPAAEDDDGVPGIPATAAHSAAPAVPAFAFTTSTSGALPRPSSAPSVQAAKLSLRGSSQQGSILQQRMSADVAQGTMAQGTATARTKQGVRGSLDSRLPGMHQPSAGHDAELRASTGVMEQVLDLRAQLEQQMTSQRALQDAQDQLSQRLHNTLTSAAPSLPATTQLQAATAHLSLPVSRSSLQTGQLSGSYLATGTSGLTGLTVRELESQLVALTLEREALEKAMLSEQGEGALLRQELQVQVAATDALESALQDARQQLQDAQDALSTQTATVEEVSQEFSALKGREAELQVTVAALQAELQNAVDSLQAQLMEARMQAERAAEAMSRRDQERSLLAQDMERIRSLYEATIRQIEFQNKREEAIGHLVWRNLARRALHALRRAANASGRERAQERSAESMSAWWRMHRSMRHWRLVVHRTCLLRHIAARVRLGCAADAFQRWREIHRAAKSVAARLEHAALHFAGRSLRVVFAAWRMQSQRHSATAKYEDPAAATLAHRFALVLTKRKAFAAWNQFVMDHARPKVAAANRAARWFTRGLVQHSWRQWNQFVVDNQAKKRFMRRILLRCDARLAMRAWHCWQAYVDTRHKHRQAASAATLQRTHRLIRAWAAQAKHSREVKQSVAGMAARRCLRLEHLALRSWCEYVRSRRRLAVGMQMAEGHHARSALYRSFWAWSRAAELAAAAKAQAHGVLEFQRLVQVVLRWRRLAEGAARQAAIVDRAVRMYNHRVVTATQGAVLREWHLMTTIRRMRRQEACAVFVHAFAVGSAQLLLHRAFYRWRWLRVDGIRAKCATGLAQIGEAAAASAHMQDRLSRSDAEKQRLLDALDKATAQIEGLSDAKAEADQRASALEAANGELQVQAAEMSARLQQVTQERDALWSEAQSLSARVQSADAEAGGMRAELASLKQALESAQQGSREMQLRFTQQAGQHELQLQSLQEEQATQARELATAQANAKRAAIIAADREAELQDLRATFEVQLSALRAELQARDEQLEFLQQHAVSQAQLLPPELPQSRLPAVGLGLAHAGTDSAQPMPRRLHSASRVPVSMHMSGAAPVAANEFSVSKQPTVMQEVMERWGLSSSAQLQAEPSAPRLISVPQTAAIRADDVPADFSITSFVASFTSAAAKKAAAGADGTVPNAVHQHA